jgi:hypothetical protein
MLHLTMDSTAPAPEPKPRTFFAGARLVWTHQPILWWILAVNLVLAFLAARAPAEDAGAVLNHSLESAQRLVHGFDLSALAELGALPQDPLRASGSMFLWPSIVFTIYMLFMTGGLLACYSHDLRLDTAGFFQACGRHFWRFVRLLIYFAIVMIPIGILGSLAGKIYNDIDDRAVSPYSAPAFMGAALVLVLFLLICLRLWFDMAQVIAVAKDERRMHGALRQAAALLWNNFGSLFGLYFRIGLIGWILFGAGLYIWMMRLRPESTLAAFLVGQLMILFWLGTRLWQRASEAEWYKQYRTAQYAPLPMPPPSARVESTPAEIIAES